MEYAKKHFGKYLTELTYSDIEKFFSSEREESDQLEFKSNPPTAVLDSMVRTLAESIGAFLNSSGGLLIWGAPIGVKVAGKKEKVFTGNLTNVFASVEKDWLISRISDRIVPLPSGVRVQIINGEGEQKVCVFEVDESLTSPHQAEGTYYMRIDGQKKHAPHAYVEALFKKITYPQIECHIRPKLDVIERGVIVVSIDFIFINLSELENEEDFNYDITVINGYFNKGKRNFENKYVSEVDASNINKNNNNYSSSIPVPVLYFGKDKIDTQEFFFSFIEKNEGDSLNKEGTIIVQFGGKKSPLKICAYILSVNSLINGGVKNVSDGFSIVRQNELMSDVYKDLGRSKTERLNVLKVIKK